MPTRNYLTVWDWMSLAAYAMLLVYLGLRFRKRQGSTKHYFTAGGKIPGWAAGISMFAAMLSSFTFIAFPGWTYDKSIMILARELMAPFAVLLCAFIVVPLYRNTIRMSAYEYLEKRFGYGARLYGAVGFFSQHVMKIGVVMFTMAMAVSSITAWPVLWIILIFGTITIAYTLVGGIEGVVWTDVIQGLMMLGAGLFTVVYILFFSGVSPAHILSTAWHGGKFNVITSGFSWKTDTTAAFMVFGFYHFLTKYTTDQTMVQRYLLSPSTKEAVKGTFVGIGACVMAWVMFALIGVLLWSYYKTHPARLAEGITKGDQMYPFFIATQLPPFFTGLVVAALIACSLNTLSSDINSAASSAISDFYDRFAKHATEESRLRLSKIMTGFFGCLAIGIGTAMSFYKGGILDMTVEVFGKMGAVMSGGLLATFLLGLFIPRVHSRALLVGVAVATAFSIWIIGCSHHWWTAPKRLDFMITGMNPLWMPALSNVLALIVALASSFAFRAARAPQELTYQGYVAERKLRRESGLGDVAAVPVAAAGGN